MFETPQSLASFCMRVVGLKDKKKMARVISFKNVCVCERERACVCVLYIEVRGQPLMSSPGITPTSFLRQGLWLPPSPLHQSSPIRLDWPDSSVNEGAGLSFLWLCPPPPSSSRQLAGWSHGHVPPSTGIFSYVS